MNDSPAPPSSSTDPRPIEIDGRRATIGPPGDRLRLWLHGGLFVATFLTATMAGSWIWEGTLDLNASWGALVDVSRLAHGVTYAALLLLILGAHEMGHYVACRYYGVPATLPFFIPGPPMLIGTLGAVIRIRGRIPSRRALFDIAAAGPIAGFVVALPLLILGIANAVELAPTKEPPGLALGPPLCSWFFEHLFHGGASLQVGSLYGAAWVGMLVTSMNLFPVGQLDGGHALFALRPKSHRGVSWTTIALLAILVVVQSIAQRSPSAYSLWLVILLGLRDRHPRLIDESEALGPGRVALAIVLLLIFAVTFIPSPILLD
jgi:membrane-associated protease RseP (regulator of RpoE activity)